MLWNSGPSYEYDAFNRMRRFRGGVAPGSEEWVFAYTADDERVFSARVGGGGTVWSLRGLDNQLLREWRAEDGKHSFRDYVWTGRNLLAKIERTPAAGSPGWSEETRHAAVDHLGSVRLWTDAAGANLPGFIYYPFGKQLNGTVDDEQMRFTGHERDLWNTTSSNDDLDYMHARHYNPQLGRFLQIDPLAGSVSAPQSLNRYAYVLGNPLSLTDPTGLSANPELYQACSSNICDASIDAGGGGLGRISWLSWWFISRWFNTPGTGGGTNGWGGEGNNGNKIPPTTSTNPTNPGEGPGEGPGNDDDDDCAPWQIAALDNVAEVTRFFTSSMPAGSLSYTTPGPVFSPAFHLNAEKNSDGSVYVYAGWGPQLGIGQGTVRPSPTLTGFSGGPEVAPGLAWRAAGAGGITVPGLFRGLAWAGSLMANKLGTLSEWSHGPSYTLGMSLWAGPGVKLPLAPPSGENFCE